MQCTKDEVIIQQLAQTDALIKQMPIDITEAALLSVDDEEADDVSRCGESVEPSHTISDTSLIKAPPTYHSNRHHSSLGNSSPVKSSVPSE